MELAEPARRCELRNADVIVGRHAAGHCAAAVASRAVSDAGGPCANGRAAAADDRAAARRARQRVRDADAATRRVRDADVGDAGTGRRARAGAAGRACGGAGTVGTGPAGRARAGNQGLTRQSGARAPGLQSQTAGTCRRFLFATQHRYGAALSTAPDPSDS
ncbi:hypothetical protein BLAT2472_30213 [Burkholderia latens]